VGLEDFDSYLDRLTAKFNIQNIPHNMKVKCLVTTIEPKLFQLLKF